MKKIVVERDPTIDVGNTSITTDDLVAILRIHADEHEITARVGDFYEHERYEFDSFLDIEKHQSLLGTPLTIKISDVTVSMGESGTHISYNNGLVAQIG
ncbi:hypothetical protein ACFMPD_16170, partial [Sedimentitalea sp. HM32M-2]|uniref:hypothetical protein n=1 Tax=Sedimentitalea sp. HM32M-2 TaxID=3351566 RepID=UPI0036367E64